MIRHSGALIIVSVRAGFMAPIARESGAGTGDVVIPIAPTDPALTPERRYSVSEFLAALRPAAESAIAHTDPLKGGQ